MHSVNLSCYGVQLTLLASLFFSEEIWRSIGSKGEGRLGEEKRGGEEGEDQVHTVQCRMYCIRDK